MARWGIGICLETLMVPNRLSTCPPRLYSHLSSSLSLYATDLVARFCDWICSLDSSVHYSSTRTNEGPSPRQVTVWWSYLCTLVQNSEHTSLPRISSSLKIVPHSSLSIPSLYQISDHGTPLGLTSLPTLHSNSWPGDRALCQWMSC